MQTGSNLVESRRIGTVLIVLKNVRGGMQEEQTKGNFQAVVHL